MLPVLGVGAPVAPSLVGLGVVPVAVVGPGVTPVGGVGEPVSPSLVGLGVATDGPEVGADGFRGGTLPELDTVNKADGTGVPPLLGVGPGVASPSLVGTIVVEVPVGAGVDAVGP